MNTVKLQQSENNQSVGLSGSNHYVNESVQKAHELIGIPYQATTGAEPFHALNASYVGITLVELQTGEVLYGYVNDESHVPTSKKIAKVGKLDGIRFATFVRRAN
jgi:hypothetical protein